MGQNKKYTNKMLFYSTIASIFGNRTDTMTFFISINQSCHIKHNAAKQVTTRQTYITCYYITLLLVFLDAIDII